MIKRSVLGRVQRTTSGRRLLSGLLALSALGGGCYASGSGAPREESSEVAQAFTPPTGSQFHDLYMIAHEDDDLLFMNPDVQESIRAGHSVRSVYLTAGDAGHDSTYWQGREEGIRQAYARMASVANPTWTSSSSTVSGKPVYRWKLDQDPLVSVVFLRLPDGNGDGSGFVSTGSVSLQKLWEGTAGTLPVLGDTSARTYTKSELDAVLLSLVSDFAPTRMHIQDLSGLYGSEHSDHIHAAKFGFVAHQAYSGAHQLVVHRDYNISGELENLRTPQFTAKQAAFCAYAQYDPEIGDCTTYGDGGAWLRRQYESAEITYANGWIAGLADKCLDLPDGNTTNGTPLQIWDCADVPNQKWILSGGKIWLAGTNKCVDLVDSTNGTRAEIWNCADVLNQKWTLTSDGMLRGLNGKCLDVTGANTANGAPVQVWDCGWQTAAGGGREVVPQQDWTVRFGVATSWTTTASSGIFSDSAVNGHYGTESYYYGSLRLGDIDRDGLADLCGRRPDGVYCSLNLGNGNYGPVTLYTTEFSDSGGWNKEEHGMTLMLGDINHDGSADICGRGVDGIDCATANSTGTGFVNFRTWTTSFSNDTDFQDGAQYYGSLRLVDVNGDGFADVCGRSIVGILCALNNQQGAFNTATAWLASEFLDLYGWDEEKYGMTIAFGDINGDGRADVCGRGATAIICATGNASGDGFENPRQWSLRDDFADAQGDWGIARSRYGSIRLGDINGDGYADVCGRSANGMVCALSTGSSFDHQRRVLPQEYTNNLGWTPDSHGMTLQLADLDNDGALDVCGRGTSAVICAHAR